MICVRSKQQNTQLYIYFFQNINLHDLKSNRLQFIAVDVLPYSPKLQQVKLRTISTDNFLLIFYGNEKFF